MCFARYRNLIVENNGEVRSVSVNPRPGNPNQRKSCRSQVDDGKKKCSYDWVPSLVHPEFALGNVTVYAKVEATKESTKVTTATIEREEGGMVEEEGRKKGIIYKHDGKLVSICSP